MRILPDYTAMGPGSTQPFSGTEGVAPYTFSLVSGDGSIDAERGIYTSPDRVPDVDDPAIVVRVTDAEGNTSDARVLVGGALQLLCDIIQQEMGILVYLWDQKRKEPTSLGPFVVAQLLTCKPFGNTNKFDPDTGDQIQSVNMQAVVSLDIKSRDNSARERKEEILMAIKSYYAQSQQSKCGFMVAPLSQSFVDLSLEDGAAIPYRFNISVVLQYFVKKVKTIPYYDTFEDAEVLTDP